MVLEDADVILSKFPNHVESILGLAQSVLENRTCRLTVQLIALGEHWTRKMEDLARKLKSPPLVCIGAHLEAAVYGRVKISFHFLESVKKSSTLAGNLCCVVFELYFCVGVDLFSFIIVNNWFLSLVCHQQLFVCRCVNGRTDVLPQSNCYL